MNVLWIFAHPEQRSLSGALRDEGLHALEDLGHECRVSDLYAMKWNATVDVDDFADRGDDDRLVVSQASEQAYRARTLSPDIQGEHDKLEWADAVIIQFPLWWYGMPAILKGWFDRVFVKGFAYGVKDARNPGRTRRYGEGNLEGKRALVVVTTGSPGPALGPRGINGQLDLVLFPLLHGTLWYVGLSVLPPFAVNGADRISTKAFAASAALLRARLANLEDADPIPYRFQNDGDYDDALVLRPGLSTGLCGLDVHKSPPTCAR